MQAEPEERVPYLAFQPDALSDLPILPIDDVQTSYYIRVRVVDRIGALADLARTLADNSISIDAMLQQGPGDEQNETDIIILTHSTREGNVDDAIAQLVEKGIVRAGVMRIRREDLS
jgi:homoserine dehydrogenase